MKNRKSAKKYDVFINYNSRDADLVNAFVQRLKEEGINCWMDYWDTVLGEEAIPQLAEAIEASSIFIVCIGKHGGGPWQKRELVTALKKRIEDKKYCIIPVFLPGVTQEVQEKLDDFLTSRTFTLFKHNLNEKLPFKWLLRTINGELKRPGSDRKVSKKSGKILQNKVTNPYKGLDKFRKADHELFFGRQNATINIIDSIEDSIDEVRFAQEKVRLFVLAGVSGCGKSSLARAGVMAGLEENWGNKWHYATVNKPGETPLFF